MPVPASVLFVCTGNQCRSVTAEIILRDLARAAGLRLSVASAGTMELRGEPAWPATSQAAAEQGFDLAQHQARTVSKSLMREAEVILAMAHRHVDALVHAFPADAPRVHLFKPYCLAQDTVAPWEGEITDPVGMPLEVQRACVGEIRDCLERLVARWTAEAAAGT